MMCLVVERHDRKHYRDGIRHVNLRQLIYESDLACVENLRMESYTFNKLCSMLHTTRKLKDSKNMSVN